MPDQIDKETAKEAMKEALREWLDDKFAQFGKFSLGAIMTMVAGVVFWLFIISQGWKK